jgi:hypothetical protein
LGIGWTLVGLGLLWGATGFAAAWWFGIASDWSDLVWRIMDGLWLGWLDTLVFLGLSAGHLVLGAIYLSDARMLRRFRAVLDHRGVSSNHRPGVVVPWERIQHVGVTGGNRGYRRLLVDDGSIPEWFWDLPKIQPGRALLRQLFGRAGFLVNVPIDRLNVEAAEIVTAIRSYSGGRFPDPVIRPPRG